MIIPDSVCLSLNVERATAEILVAELAEFGFDTFEYEGETEQGFEPPPLQSDLPSELLPPAGLQGSMTQSPTDRVGFRAFSTLPDWDAHRSDVEQVLDRYGLRGSESVTMIAPRNWNETWEASIKPIRVPPFVVRPSWAAVPVEDPPLVDILIDPKMSFGTGYHESTRLMLRAIARVVDSSKDQTVLDAGSGTGILAIAALKLGVRHVTAFDVDEWCTLNAAENFELNGCAERVTWFTGELAAVPHGTYDVILANINRNVLASILPDLASRMNPDGLILLAGLLVADRSVMVGHVEAAQLRVTNETREGDWLSLELGRA